VKSDDALKNIPFIFYTATYTTEKDKDFALSLGASRFILKPTDHVEFIAIIQEVLAEERTGLLKPGDITIEKDNEYLKEHQSRLIKKLGDKIIELQRSEERYRSIIACTIDAIITLDESGIITSWHEAAEKIFSYGADEVLGKPFSLLVPEELHAEQNAIIRRLKEKTLTGRLEAVGRSKRGDSIPIGVSLCLLKDKQGKVLGFTAILMDMTKQKRAEEELSRSEAKYRKLYLEFNSLLDAIPDSLMLLDKDLKIHWANRAVAENIGTTPAPLTGQFCYTLWYERTTPCESCPVLESFSTGQPRSETVTRPDGRIWDIRTVPLVDQQGGIANVIEVKRDITEHRKLEAQYLHAQKMESIGTLAGGIAHDFNNILSAIIGYGHVALMKMAEDDPQRLNIGSILEAADRAAQLTKGLLLFSRKQTGERKAVDLNEVVKKVENFMRRIIGEDIECKTMLQERPIPIYADNNQLEHVLMNLATNARDAMPEGGAFTIQTEEVALHADFPAAHGYGKPGLYAMLTVSDTGMGMDEETRKHIFEPFFTTKGVGKGTGLGLAMAYGIIKQHEGFINVYSEPNKGSTFRIYLPLIAPEAVEDATMHQEEAPARGAETVLLAEDDASLRKLSRTVLAQYGYTVIEANDGEDAVKKFIENKDTIHLLLFDLIMPKMNGKEAYDEIRKIQPDMKVIFVSGYAPDIIRQKSSLEKGAHLVYKPIAPIDLVRKVRSVLDGAVQ
jgi:two-component system cell cycle sensor histidine kinase/response regulator CckA